MNMMNKTVTLKSTGINSIDNTWGGFYNGSTYVINGPEKSGRTSLALQYAYHAALRGEVVVLFTDVRPRKLIVAAHSQGMNIQPLIENNKLIILRMAPLRMSEDIDDRDVYLSEFLFDILKAANEFKPSSVIFDELTPYMDFNDKDSFLDIFNEIIESLEDMLITSIFIVQDDVAFDNGSIHKELENIATGNIRLGKEESNSQAEKSDNRMRVISNAGCCDEVKNNSHDMIEVNAAADGNIEITPQVSEQEIKIAAMA